MNIFVGNLSFHTSERDLKTAFVNFGEVSSVKIVTDNYTHRSRGFGFVEMADRSAGLKAIEKLNNTILNMKNIVVNEVRPQSTNERNSENRMN